MAYQITVIPGDGIGKEITDSAVAVLKKADEKLGLGLSFDYHDAGGTAYDKFGTPLEPGALTRFFLTAAATDTSDRYNRR